jgi:hypothetical protein
MGFSPGDVLNAPMGISPGAVLPGGAEGLADLYGGPNVRDPNDFRDIMRLDAPLAAGPGGASPIPGDELNIIDPMNLENDVIFMSRKDGSITDRYPGSVEVAALGDFTPPPAADPASVYHPSRPAATLEYIVENMEGQSLLNPQTLTVGDIEKAAFRQGVNIADIPGKDIETWLEKTNPGLLQRNRLPLTGLGVASAVFKDKLFGEDDEDPSDAEAAARMNEAKRNELWYVADLPREPGETDEDYADRNNANKFAERQNRGYIIRDFQNPYTALVASGGLMQSGARGGFPRRELLIEGSGTERSDDIPAMLSDGEFVMNASAVRGADPTGRGSRRAGARNLYNIMRNFEMRA